ncbi:MAG: nitroreductase family protein [Chitinivibrionales bacterium]|nr:nitroreductase family protein [Chitinivibrionales bacterium]
MASSMIEIIKQRYSVRSYDKKPIEPSKRDQIVEFLRSNTTGPLGCKVRFELVEIAENQKDQLKELGTYGMIKGASVFIAGAVTKGPRAMEDFGYCMERNILKATGLELGTCWLGGSLKRSAFAARINLAADELIPAVTPLGYVVSKRPVRDSIIRFAVGSNGRKPFSTLFFDQTTDRPLTGNPDDPVIRALECVRLAPSASNKQPWRIVKDVDNHSYHFYIKLDPMYNKFFKEIKIQFVDMGIAMCHFELALKDQVISGEWKDAKPSIDAGGFKYVISFTIKK